jgi:hypothetical protein
MDPLALVVLSPITESGVLTSTACTKFASAALLKPDPLWRRLRPQHTEYALSVEQRGPESTQGRYVSLLPAPRRLIQPPLAASRFFRSSIAKEGRFCPIR